MAATVMVKVRWVHDRRQAAGADRRGDVIAAGLRPIMARVTSEESRRRECPPYAARSCSRS